MVEIKATCYLKGDNFTETEIIDNSGLILHAVISSKPNDKLPIKKFNKVISILPEENGIHEDDYSYLLEKFIKLIEKQKMLFIASGCEKIILHLDIKYTEQCNFEFNGMLLKDIGKVFDDLYITCYENEFN